MAARYNSIKVHNSFTVPDPINSFAISFDNPFSAAKFLESYTLHYLKRVITPGVNLFISISNIK